MKYILICVQNDSNIGGAEEVLRMIAKEFLSQNYAVNVFFKHKRKYGGWDMENTPNLTLFYSKSSRARYGIFLTLVQMFQMRKINYEYAFTSSVTDAGIIGVLRKLHVLKINYFVARESTSIFKRIKGFELVWLKLFYCLGYSVVDLLICQTEYMKKQLINNLLWIEKKSNVQVIPNPVNLNHMSVKANKELLILTGDPFIISAGRFINEKGFDILIRAFSILKPAYKCLKLVILGDGKLKDEIETLIEKLKLEKDVILYGFTDNVYPFFKNARMCVVSSRIEGFPNVLLQMMSQNEKVVSTLCAGDIDKIQGLFTCRTNDVKDLLRAMQQCLDAETSENRMLFDRELQSRSIDRFIGKIKSYENGNR
ncbi:MAG: glycosyltransferase [Tannerellaceae bacterium]|jgi:glycosyltransferase involved in cell wall biosynthesis|nr:glycosyltransferase [Tannerellaceae bacterium]